jgi:hypothetical protein
MAFEQLNHASILSIHALYGVSQYLQRGGGSTLVEAARLLALTATARVLLELVAVGGVSQMGDQLVQEVAVERHLYGVSQCVCVVISAWIMQHVNICMHCMV